MTQSASPWQRLALVEDLPSTGHVVLEASAGTGKTYTIERLLIDLLLVHKIPLPEILVVTFTEKATAELRLRLYQQIQEIHQELQQKGEEELAQVALTALWQFDEAAIHTIHAFASSIRREQSFTNGRLFSEELCNDESAFSEAFRRSMRVWLAGDKAELLSYWLQKHSMENLESTLQKMLDDPAVIWPTFSEGPYLSSYQRVTDYIHSSGFCEATIGQVKERSNAKPP